MYTSLHLYCTIYYMKTIFIHKYQPHTIHSDTYQSCTILVFFLFLLFYMRCHLRLYHVKGTHLPVCCLSKQTKMVPHVQGKNALYPSNELN